MVHATFFCPALRFFPMNLEKKDTDSINNILFLEFEFEYQTNNCYGESNNRRRSEEMSERINGSKQDGGVGGRGSHT